MRLWNLERKLVAGVLVLFLIPTVLAGAVLALLYHRGTLEDPSALALAVVLGFVTMMAYLGFTAHTIGRTLVGTLQQIQRGTELMASVNPDYRHRIETGDELQSVAEEINRMADRVRDVRLDLESEVERATRELYSERAKLSAILDELDEGVLVATMDGRVTLANRAAVKLLGAGPVLGRSVFDFADRETLTHFRDRLRAGHAAAERFTLRGDGGAVLQAGMTCLSDPDGDTAGIILALRDVSQPAREEEAQHRLLEDAVREIRGSLTSIRSLAESLVADTSTADTPAHPLLRAIHSEAVRLSGVVTAMGRSTRLAGASRELEHVTIADLIGMSVRRLGPDAAAIAPGDPVAGVPPLRAEVAALSTALAHLLRTVLAHRDGAGMVSLGHVRRGQVLQMEVRADTGATAAALEACLDVPIEAGATRRLTVREIVRRHAGEVWAYAQDGHGGFRITLALAEGPEAPGPGPEPARPTSFIGASLLSGAGRRAPRSDRSRLYDFSFFDQMERHVPGSVRERPLEDLSLVALDTETTGLRPEDGDRIVSLAGVKIRGGAVRHGEVFDALVQPGRAVPAESSRFHGITDAMVAEAPPIDVVLPAFERFAEGTVLVGHEIWFDLRFLAREAHRLGLPPLTDVHPILDVRWLSQAVHGSSADHTLDAVAARMGVAIQGRHSALGDAIIAAEVFVRLVPLLNKRGIVTLGDALDAAQVTRSRGPASRPPA